MDYRAPRWLPGGHLQTIVPALFMRRPQVHFTRERWITPDHDFVDVDRLHGQVGKPLVVLFHGLEGSSGSHYARALMSELAALGWHGAVPHFRGCSGETNRSPRFYHSGDSAEIDWVLKRFNGEKASHSRLYVVGVSLGGNALLRWLGESGQGAGFVDAACSVSAPLDLAAGGHALAKGPNLLYTRTFLRTLKPKCLAKLEQFPELFDRRRMLAARNLHEFDDVVTAPLHGYRDADDYWHRASARHVLDAIRVPTLILNALNDPFLPRQCLPRSASKAVTLEYPDHGGHVGFGMGPMPGSLEWLPKRLLRFMEQAAPSQHGREGSRADLATEGTGGIAKFRT